MRAVFRLTAVVFVFLLALAVKAESAATLPAPTGYVDDYANVLSSPAKTEFEALCVELHEKTKAQVFVVTVKSLDGAVVDTFANDLFHRWKIGEKKTDRGVLLLFSVKDHKWRIEVGYGLEGVLNDAKVGDVGRAMVPDLHAGRWDDGVRIGLRSVTQSIADDAKIQLDGLQIASSVADVPSAPVHHAPTSKGGGWIFFSLFFAVWLSLFGFGIFSMFRNRGSRQRGTSSSSSGGFFSSSSSDSSSSSSDDFGGGDGGDSGGGGASGDF